VNDGPEGRARDRSRPSGAGRPARRGLPLLLVLGLLPGCGSTAPEADRPGRIILVSMDTVRADGVLGEDGIALPGLARIAEDGVVFRRFYAASNYTLPSHMSIFTGLDAAEHGVLVGRARLAPQVPTLAELLAEAGYRTQSFNEGVFVHARYGFERGFDEYRMLPFGSVVDSRLDEILAWLREHAREPYFLFLHTYAAHTPYGGYARYREEHPERGLLSEQEIESLREHFPFGARHAGRELPEVSDSTRKQCSLYNWLAPAPWRQLACVAERFEEEFPESAHFESDLDALKQSYADRIALVDQALSRIRATLVDLAQWDDTLLVVTSDHGEAFFEHGSFEHSYVPFDEVLRVPLVITLPERLPAWKAREVGALAWHLDLMPTILELAGVESVATQGRSLVPVLEGRSAPARGVFPAVLPSAHRPRLPMRRVVVRDTFKHIPGHPKFGDPAGFLFDLGADPGETHNLRDSHADGVGWLSSLRRGFETRLERTPPVDQETGEVLDAASPLRGAAPRLSEQEREALRAMGYLD
jgi:arylsulfatase A-like enzyme